MDWVLFRCGYLLAPMKDYSVFFVGAENEHGEICIYGEIKKRKAYQCGLRKTTYCGNRHE